MGPQTYIPNFRFQWHWHWKVLAFTGLFLPLTIALGFWQLHRADEKRTLLASYQQRQATQLKALPDADADNQYVPVQLQGRFDNSRTILLENRVRHGKPGYEVLTLFLPQGADAPVLVNRGWIAGGLDRQVLPVVPAVSGTQTITGYLYQPVGKPLVLGEESWRETWPQVVQNLSIDAVNRRVGITLFPYRVRLDTISPGALETGWPVINMQPSKHIGYAVQWFALAVALVILALFANSNLGVLFRKRARG